MSATSTNWAAAAERGCATWLGIMRRIVLTLGAPAGRAILPGIVLWFYLTSPAARAASRDYLGRVLGRPARAWDVGRHFYAFAQSIFDRALLLMGRVGAEALDVQGLPLIEAALAQGRGCLLLGAHLGGFEALRLLGKQAPARVRPLMYRQNAGAMTALLDCLNPAPLADVIELGRTTAMLEAREAVARGEILGVLADRGATDGADRRWVMAPFLGAPAPFPVGPFALAHALGAPVLLFRAVRTRTGWTIAFEPFADRVVLRRGADRAVDLSHYAGRYAAALDRACRAHPFQWFNFYQFWKTYSDAAPDVAADARRPPGAGRNAGHPGADGAPGRRAGTPGALPGGEADCRPDHAADQHRHALLSPPIPAGEGDDISGARDAGTGWQPDRADAGR